MSDSFKTPPRGQATLGFASLSAHELFAYICVKNAEEAIRFYTTAFGATEKFRLTEPGGRIGHVSPEEMQRRYDALFR